MNRQININVNININIKDGNLLALNFINVPILLVSTIKKKNVCFKKHNALLIALKQWFLANGRDA